MIRTAYLAAILLLSVGLSLGMWIAGSVPFDLFTFVLHVASIVIGISATLLFQRWQARILAAAFTK